MTLADLVAEPGAKARWIDDCVRAVEDEVRSKSGLGGIAMKAGYAAFQKVKPGMTRSGVVRLLPEMIPVLDRWWVDCGANPAALTDRRHAVAESLLGVTDQIALRSRHSVLVRMYRSLRPAAQEHVAQGVPRLGALLRAHLG